MRLTRSRWATIGAAVAVTLGAGGVGLVGADVSSGERTVFVPVTPCRVIDTRPAFQVGPRSVPLGTADTHTVSAHGTNGNCTIPADAVALALNVTAVDATLPTYLTIWAAGETRPYASSLNPAPGQPPTPNAVTTDLSSGGQFNIYNLQGSVHVLADVIGYYAGHDHDDRYYTEVEVDTRIESISPNRLDDEQIALLQWYLDPGAAGTLLVDSGPEGVAFDGTHVWIANTIADTVTRIDPKSGARYDFAGRDRPRRLAYDGTSIWVTNTNDSSVSRFDAVTGARVDFDVGVGPIGIAFDGTNIWVANYDDHTVKKIDPTTGLTIATYGVGLNPIGIAFDGTSVWVTNAMADTVSKLNPATGTRVDFAVGDNPYGVAFDGAHIWVANRGADTVSKIDPASGAAIGTYATGDSPTAVAFDGTSVWVTNQVSDTVSRINPATGTAIDVYPVGDTPAGVAFDGINIWVTNFSDGTVSKLNPG